MDKLAYHFNKKKIPAKSAGKYKYYYTCLLKDVADERYGDNYYIVTEVSEHEWESLLELDRLEYNNTHKFTRHSSTMPSANEDRLSVKQQQKRISDDDSLETVLEQTADENNMEVKKMNNYYWNKRNVSLDKDEIAPWKLPREKHATISVLLHRENELQTVDDYLATCEELYDVDYKKRLNGSTTEAWDKTLNRLHARYNKRKNNKVLECLQFGGNKEFWDGFQSENEILAYFEKCYEYAVQKIGYMQTDKNIICAVKIFSRTGEIFRILLARYRNMARKSYERREKRIRRTFTKNRRTRRTCISFENKSRNTDFISFGVLETTRRTYRVFRITGRFL